MNSIIKDRLEKIEKGIVPAGYKKTKLGILPEDWEVKKLTKLAKITMGQSPKSVNYNSEGIGLPLVQGNADMKLGYTSPKMYTSEITKVCDIGDIILSVRAPVGALAISKHNACIGRGVCSIKANKFIYYYLSKNQDKLAKYSQGSTFSAINSSDIRGLLIKTPPLEEQEEIAHILSTWDKAIENIEKLIQEKEIQKKGLMQELLTGKTRLAGFTGDWEEVRLGDISEIKTGKLDANAMVEDGKYKFFTCAKESYNIDKYAYDTEALLVSGNGANVGYIHYYKGKFNAYQRTYILDKFVKDIWFVKYLLDLKLERRIFREKRSGNTPYITISTLTEMILNLPPLSEQKAIAEILSTADQEIELLKELREEKKEEKKGLMQLLLTGVVRVREV